mmetsp:Transcript_30768/g.70413  ORF Transcript_30768/g.70413 Transcript_30768/m.70413 type:complete len:82 (-) Transcript_30768:1056-1301(-)
MSNAVYTSSSLLLTPIWISMWDVPYGLLHRARVIWSSKLRPRHVVPHPLHGRSVSVLLVNAMEIRPVSSEHPSVEGVASAY